VSNEPPIEQHDAHDDPSREGDLEEPTWAEISELMTTLRDREHHLRRRGWWARAFDATVRLESLLSKLRRAFHRRNE
jgi:phage gp46-like protein